MKEYQVQILETVIIVTLYIVAYLITKNVINNALKNAQLQRARRKIIIKAVQLLSTIASVVLIAAVWGLNQNEIAVFASTLITALGIAFFAQWSLLSNITSGILLFFNHPAKLGDFVRVMDKDYPVEGEITEITYFFVHLKTKSGEIITVPNSVFIVKSVSVTSSEEVK